MERRVPAKKRRRVGHIDYPIVLMIGLLCAFGLVMVFSASYYYAQNTASVGYDGYYYIRKQAMYLAIGFPMMLVISLIDFRKLERFKLVGTPVRFVFRESDNPYKDKVNVLTPTQKAKRQRMIRHHKRNDK